MAALEERQKQLVELCERQVADARESRDEEVARCQQEVALAQGQAARAESEIVAGGWQWGLNGWMGGWMVACLPVGTSGVLALVTCLMSSSLVSAPVTAGYEKQVAAASAGEREARQRAQQLLEESEHVRSQLQRAEARVAEQELAMQRMVAQFEGALATLQQLGAQYDGLAADAGAAERLRAARIAQLEEENEGLRVARAGVQQERDASVTGLSAALAEAERGASEAKQQYHRAMMDGAELSEALAGARQEAATARGRAQAAEEELAGLRGEAAAARGALERESAALAQGLLEASRLHQEAARRDAQEQERLAAAVREAAAVLEAERNDLAKAAEAAEAKVGGWAGGADGVWLGDVV